MSLALAPVQIPKNFLLSEKAARTPQSDEVRAEEWWEISDKLNKPLLGNPCGRKGATTADRSAARTIVHHTSAPSYSGEQLVIYRSTKAAKKAMSKLFADAGQCATQPDGKPYSWTGDGKTRWVVSRTRLAHEAALMRMMMYDKLNKDWSSLLSGLVARKGRALMIHIGDQEALGYERKQAVKTLRSTAIKMAAKVCALPGVC
ncbi:hypothetical protein AB0B45_15260 [Nonomuraea sp. NPDC049152]|uniref:hypothetical protein n=1 Tax=Nonomuraea sp. NPDC049152 TaxID=3154350 RepID=UPI0033D7FB9C